MISDDSIVFIIDDDDAVRHSLMLMIEQEGIPVQVFESAEAFLKHFQPQFKGCIILDINMPGMDGLQLQETLGNYECSLPIIFLTGFGSVPQSVKALKMGAVDFLIKPVTREKLIESIRSAFVKCENLIQVRRHNHKTKSFLSKLTAREKEILGLVLQGRSNKEIGLDLDISYRTVEIHRRNIMHKAGATNLLELAELAHKIV